MPLIKIGFGLMLVFSFITVMIGLNCAGESDDDSDDDDNNDIDDDDDSASDSCHTVINPEADKAKATAMSYSSADVGDCLPELPDPIHEELLTALLNAYLGQYHSEVGTIRTISCRPEGEWEVPNYDAEDWWCGYHYIIPIWIEYVEITGLYKGSIRQDVLSNCAIDNLFEVPSSMYFDIENETKVANCSIGEYVVWEFGEASEQEGFITWTKDEPFGE